MLLLFPFAWAANGRQGWGRRTGPAPAGRRRKGRARSRLHGPAAGCVTRNRGLTLLRPPHPPPPPSTARGSPPGPGRAAPTTHQRQKQSCPQLLHRAAASGPCRPGSRPAGEPALPGGPRRAHRRLPRGRRRGKSARNAPASRGALPRAFPFACGKGSRRVPREAVRRQPGPERPLRPSERRSARCRPRPLGLALPAAAPGPAARLGPATSRPPAPRPCRDCTDCARQPHERLAAHSSSALAADVTSYLPKLIVKIAALPRP